MAAQDLQIQPRHTRYLPQQQVASQPSHLPVESGETKPSVLISALRRRWWLFLLIGCASTIVAREAMEFFGKDSSRSSASLIQTGLPNSPDGGEVIKSMAPTTCAELITSFHVLDKLCESRGVNISPKILQEQIETKTTRGSSLLNVEFVWANAEDGVAMLNELLEIFVEDIATQRRSTLRDHMRHVENALLQSRAEVADARQQIFEVQAEQQKVLDEGGLNSARYHNILQSVSSTQLGVDEKRVEQLGVMQQIEVIQQKGDSLDSRIEEVLRDYKFQVVRKIAGRLRRVEQQMTKSSPAFAKMTELISNIEGFASSDESPADVQLWQVGLHEMVSESGLPISEPVMQEIAAAVETQNEAFGGQLKQIDLQRQQLAKQKEQLELSVIPLKNQMKMLEARLADYQNQAAEIGEQLTGIGADKFGAYELQLEQAESQQKALSAQLENMRQLEKCRVREWSVSVPASLETTEVSSNRTKLFALAFGLCGLVLSLPVLGSEWYRQQTSPQVAFANSLQLPVLAERILQDFSPRGRKRKGRSTISKLSEEQLEVVRMLALRIQQSSHSDGSVVLFSSIDSHYSAAPLMASVAECLAQREEKVLIVDAVCPAKSRLPVSNLLPMPAPQATDDPQQHEDAGDGEQPGLSEYFTTGCQTMSELAIHTGCPGVDLISSGHAAFPREALASSCLTELVEQCREKYSMILVNGPAATATADLQMLTARADGVVLMATREVGKNPRARAAVVDLIELGAPIIGVVA